MPEPACKAEEAEWDDFHAETLWRRWLARHGYLNRTPRDRGFRRHQRQRATRRRLDLARRVIGASGPRSPWHIQRGRSGLWRDSTWGGECARWRERRLRAQDAVDHAA